MHKHENDMNINRNLMNGFVYEYESHGYEYEQEAHENEHEYEYEVHEYEYQVHGYERQIYTYSLELYELIFQVPILSRIFFYNISRLMNMNNEKSMNP